MEREALAGPHDTKKLEYALPGRQEKTYYGIDAAYFCCNGLARSIVLAPSMAI
jgi:hypothetical protein